MAERLPDDYVAKALQDARRFQGCWDAGTSGSLAAHTFRLIREREGLLGTIKELEERNAALRAAVEGRLAKLPADDPKRVGLDLPAEVLAATAGLTVVPATLPEPLGDQPHFVGSTVPVRALESAWEGVKARRAAMEERVRGGLPQEPLAIETIHARPAKALPPVIGITGRAGAGKNLAASLVPGGTVIQLADPIYDMLAVMLGVSVEQLRDREFKESPVPWVGKSPRELLQTLGTEWGRNTIRQDLWIVVARRRIAELLEAGRGPVVVADVRFDNEADMIRASGGVIWKIFRGASPDAGGHSSEAGISPHLIDRTIFNTGTVADLRTAVDLALE